MSVFVPQEQSIQTKWIEVRLKPNPTLYLLLFPTEEGGILEEGKEEEENENFEKGIED